MGIRLLAFVPLIFLAGVPGYSLNPIHYNSYNLVPSPIYYQTVHMSAGLYLNPQDPDDLSAFSLPLSLALNLTPDFELGTGLQTHWGQNGNVITHFLVAAKLGLAGKATVQGDLLVGTRGNSNGFSVTYLKRTDLYRRFYNYSQFKFGLMEHFTNDALLAFEAGFYPTLNITSPLSLQMGFITSSQSNEFENHLAMDLLPSLIINLQGSSDLSLGLTLGLAGNRKSSFGLQAIVQFSL